MLLSVVVTAVDCGTALTNCLEALQEQERPPAMEILVPYDETISEVARLAGQFPNVQFMPLGSLSREPSANPFAAQHELYDRRRAAGLRSATGDLVAILEDRGIPDRNWAATAARLHQHLPHRVIGGAVDNGVDRLLNWAVYFCDFSRYQPPFPAGPRQFVSDVNVVYKRSALEDTRDIWYDRYHEPAVHWALTRAGGILWLTPELVVRQYRSMLTFRGLLHERLTWGALYARIRENHGDLTRGRRLQLILLSPLLPAVLFARIVRQQCRSRASRAKFMVASCLVFVLVAASAVGETWIHVSSAMRDTSSRARS
jgi:hypothetical protein